MHRPCERCSSEYQVEDFNNEPLSSELRGNHKEEPEVAETYQFTHEVNIVPSEFAGSELVKEVHQHEGMEQYCVMLEHVERFNVSSVIEVSVNIVVCNAEPIGDTVEHDNQNKELIGCL